MSEITQSVAKIPELKPCPFCGSAARQHLPDFGLAMIYCGAVDCPSNPETGFHDTSEQAAAAWNTRTPDLAALEAERDGLRKVAEPITIAEWGDAAHNAPARDNGFDRANRILAKRAAALAGQPAQGEQACDCPCHETRLSAALLHAYHKIDQHLRGQYPEGQALRSALANINAALAPLTPEGGK